MKKNYYLVIIQLLLSFGAFAQVVAYPSVNDSNVLGASCTDLHYVNPFVVGHQNNVSVVYYISLSDAQNEINVLPRFYEPISNPQTIYARVNSNVDSDFVIEECTLISEEAGGGPPPGITPCYFDVCDMDGNGSEEVYLNNLQCKYSGYGFPTETFCASSDDDIETTFYLSHSDAENETNPINGVYTITSSQTFYRKIKNTTTNEFLIDDLLNVNLVSCSTDTDSDGIPDLAEDANKNSLYTDDDTDKDGLKNYEDDDDDNDGILTINEDANNNGNPADDDTNVNGVPDYLEAESTLSTRKAIILDFRLYPNPVKNGFNIESKHGINSICIYTVSGRVVEKNNYENPELTVSISSKKLSKGTYFIKVISEYGTAYRRLVKE